MNNKVDKPEDEMCLNKGLGISKRTIRIWLLLSLGIVVAFCVVFMVRKAVFFVPNWAEFEEKEQTTYDGLLVSLSDGKVSIKDKNNTLTWISGNELKVQDFLISDLDGDGTQELITLVWKKGRYGKDKPFWVSENDSGISQHLFVYEIHTDGTTNQKWFASDVGTEIRRMKLMEKNSSILLTETIEGDNDLWKWESFGLKNIENEVRFVAFGDNIIHQEIYDYANKAKNGNFDFLYEPFREEIENADIAAIQAETVLVNKDSAVSGYPLFGSPVAVGEAIAKAGFDIAVCSNNHALDKGIYGVDVTTDFYSKNGVTCIGIQNSTDASFEPYKLIARNGITFALFSYTYGTNGIDIADKYPYAVHYLNSSITTDIESAKSEADVVIVFVHWGEEYNTEITSDQMYYTDLFSNAGADVVIGTHPHVIQKVETVTRPDGKPMTIYYSLGNFRAYQGQSADTKTGAEAILTFEHTYDGVRLIDSQLEELDSFVELK